MKLANNISIRVFCSEEENNEKILAKLKELIGLDLEKEKLTIKQKTATGFGEKKIMVYKITLSKERHTNSFLGNLNQLLGAEQKQLLLKQLQSRLDEELNFFMRLDKGDLINNNICRLTDRGNCYHIKINVACFPRKRAKAVSVVREIFK